MPVETNSKAPASTWKLAGQASLLLKEYAQKVQDLMAEAVSIRRGYAASGSLTMSAAKTKGIQERFRLLRPLLEDLARKVSPQIEQGRLDDMTRLELKLRLTELESILREAADVLQRA